MPGRKQDCVWLYLKFNKSTCMHLLGISKDAVRNANHVEKICKAYIVARMKQHHKCMSCTYCIGLHCMDCTAWVRTAWGCTAWGCTAWGCTAWGCTTWGCTA